MKYITVGQILESDERVRREIIKWWKPELGDLCEGKNNTIRVIDNLEKKRIIEETNSTLKDVVMPLLTVGQLINFIEEQLGGYIDIAKEITGGYNIYNTYIDYTGKYEYDFETQNNDFLLALWECLQDIVLNYERN